MNIFVLHASDMLTDYRPHGDGLVAFGFIQSLAARGHQIHVAVHHSDIRQPLPSNIHLYPIHTRTAKGPLQRLQYMLAVRRLLQSLRRQTDIHIVHQLNPVFTGLSLAVAGSGLPLVLGPYVGDWPAISKPSPPMPSLKRTLESLGKACIARLQQSGADLLLVTTPDATRRIPAAKRLESRIRVLPHGIDISLFAPDPMELTPPRQPSQARPLTILFYAHVWYGKGPDTLLDAFDCIADAVPGVQLTIAGDGGDRIALEARALSLRHAGQVTFLGAWSRDRAVELFHQAAVYCLPSRGEPFGMTALEAMSCGVPVVATNIGGLGHLVQPGGGRTIAPGDSDSLAAAVIEILGTPTLRASMGRFNRELVERNYAWASLGERLESLYLEALRNHSRLV